MEANDSLVNRNSSITSQAAAAPELVTSTTRQLSRVLLVHHHNHQNDHTNHRHYNNHQSQLDSSSSPSVTAIAADQAYQETHQQVASSFVDQYVDFNLVRKMIAQNLIEIIIVCVIIIYLVYYFNRISKRPRLIGDHRSKFVQFIKLSLSDTLKSRFSPLIYFWGTNPQTALFGYLQGQTSTKEMPRESFQRQYLYVSDVQYLTSNVDLREHYESKQQAQHKHRNLKLRPFAELEPDKLARETGAGLLNQNIRLALDEMLLQQQQQQQQQQHQHQQYQQQERKAMNVDDQFVVVVDGGDSAKDQDQSSSSGSSSDSGVFATGDNSPTSGSSSRASSLSDVLIEQTQQQQCDKCNRINANYNSNKMPLQDLLVPIQVIGPALPTESDPQQPEADEIHTDNGPIANERIEFGQCALDWHRSSHKLYHKNKLVALISAGMTTGSDKKYVTDTVQTLEGLGYEVCVFIRRGVGGLKLSSAKFFSPAKWRDFEAAVMSIRQQRPGARLVAIGFSFGSIELCRYLSMSGKRSLIDAALLISCPFDPEAGGRNMRKRALNRRIDAYLAKNLGKQLYHAMFTGNQTGGSSLNDQQQHQQSAIKNHNGSMVDLTSLPKIKSLVDFEDNFNRVLQNYPDSAAYAADSRLQHSLGSIETPTLCLSSGDDFMAPLKLLPLEQIKANRNLCMVLTRRGGHMAFIDGILWPKKPYFAQRIIGKYMENVRESMFAGNQLFAPKSRSILISAATEGSHRVIIDDSTLLSGTNDIKFNVSSHDSSVSSNNNKINKQSTSLMQMFVVPTNKESEVVNDQTHR